MLLSAPLYAIIYFVDLYYLQIIVASQTNFLLGLLGYDVVQEGFSLQVSSHQPFLFFISGDSTGWKSMLFYAALVMAVPAAASDRINYKSRAKAVALGLPVIWAGNTARILGIVIVQQSYGFWAGMLFHDYIYRMGLVFLVVALWYFWIRNNLITKTKK